MEVDGSADSEKKLDQRKKRDFQAVARDRRIHRLAPGVCCRS